MQEMIDLFDIHDVNKAASALNPDKLLWLNQHYLKSADTERLSELLGQYLRDLGLDTNQGPLIRDLYEVQKQRCKTLAEMAEQSRFFYEDF